MTGPRSEAHQELEVPLAALVEGDLSNAQKARLGDLLREDPQARRFYKRYLEVHVMLEWEAGTALAQQSDADKLQDLLRMESQAHAELVHDLGQLRWGNKRPVQAAGAVQWLIRNPGVWGGIAAMLAIALVLVSVLNTGSTTEPTPRTPIAQHPSIPEKTTTPVATITATHNAVWAHNSAEGASAPMSGSKLKPGQQLTLTAGFAEITTHRGAIAILEAPATIELLNNDNALHLHAGKLVGICETESSKGFIVHTPHMDITDLGTEFGVEVLDHEITTTVFTGEVAVTTPGGEPQPIVANQTARLSNDTGVTRVVVEDRVAAGFVRHLPGSAYGRRIAITNHSFEDGRSGWSGAMTFIEASASDEFGFAAPEGKDVLFVFRPTDRTSQVLGVLLQPNTTYTLQVEVLHGAGDEPFINSLLAIGFGEGGPKDGTELARITSGDPGAPIPPSDAPQDRVKTWTLTYTTGDAPVGEGQPLWIQVGADDSPDIGRAGYDNIRLYAAPAQQPPTERN